MNEILGCYNTLFSVEIGCFHELLYTNQFGSVHGSTPFCILRGVKQGDPLSAMLFNCILDAAFRNWKIKLRTEGILIDAHGERLTNTRYADDILLYAKSLTELEHMSELLISELREVGLHLNAKKSKILHTQFDKDSDKDFVDIDADFIKILHNTDYHRYLGR